MPRSAAIHYNGEDDVRVACGRRLDKVKWDTQPMHVTCLNCKKVMK